MKILPVISVLLLAVALCVSCGSDRRIDAVLSAADSLVFAAPDSAVALLESLDASRGSDDQIDRHALLLAKAREKAYVTVSDAAPDSLLSRSIASLDRAVKHFRGRGDSLEVQTLFYRGVLLGYRGDYSDALVSLMEAADRAADTDAHFYRAMAYSEQADVYSRLYSFAESFENSMLAAEYFTKANRPLYALREKIMSARHLVRLNDASRSLSILKELECDSLLSDTSNRAFAALYHRTKADALRAAGDYHNALTHVDTVKIYAGYLSSIQLSEKSDILSAVGLTGEAEKVLEEAERYARTKNDTANLLYSQSKLFAAQRQYEKAYNTFMKYNSEQVITTNRLLSHPYTTLLYKHFEDQSELNRNQVIQTRKFAWTFAALCVLLVVSIVCLIIIFCYKSQRNKEQAEMLMADIELFRKRIADYESQTERSRASSVTHNAVKHPFLAIVNELCEYSDIYPTDDNGYLSLGKKASGLVEAFRKPQFLADLEYFINATNNNIMQRFREQFSQMSNKKLSAMLMIFAGFSNHFISVVLRYNSFASVRTIRHRLKSEIAQSSADDREEFLGYI